MGQNLINLITFGIAVVGAILGIINTVYAIDKDRIKLRVRPVFGYTVGAPHLKEKYIGVEIINLSIFPVSIAEAGFMLEKTTQRAAILNPLTHKGVISLPYKLPSREKITLYADYDYMIDDPYLIKCVYCATECGLVTKGKSKAINHINEEKIKKLVKKIENSNP
ncbi:hypothetical protein EPN54_01410 [bacterium]|nr:MAG: hypothetical protein EPN54_01410 [bacterium]